MEVSSGDARVVTLDNEVSAAMRKAMLAGLRPDFTCAVVVGVAADHWIQTYARPVTDLSDILTVKAARFAGAQGGGGAKAPGGRLRRLLTWARDFWRDM